MVVGDDGSLPALCVRLACFQVTPTWWLVMMNHCLPCMCAWIPGDAYVVVGDDSLPVCVPGLFQVTPTWWLMMTHCLPYVWAWLAYR